MNYNTYISQLGIEALPVGTCLKSETGGIYEVTQVWPSIGGSTPPQFTLKHLLSGEEYVCNYNDVRYHRLKTIPQEEVPLALLGAA